MVVGVCTNNGTPISLAAEKKGYTEVDVVDTIAKTTKAKKMSGLAVRTVGNQPGQLEDKVITAQWEADKNPINYTFELQSDDGNTTKELYYRRGTSKFDNKDGHVADISEQVLRVGFDTTPYTADGGSVANTHINQTTGTDFKNNDYFKNNNPVLYKLDEKDNESAKITNQLR